MSATNVNLPVPSSRDFTWVGAVYGLYAAGLLMLWPALIGVVVAYAKRHDVLPLLSSHYRWLIKTYWWWFAGWVLIIGVMLAVIVPNAFEIDAAVRSQRYFNIPWELLGAAVFGGLALMIVWLWVFYRIVRGAIRLSDGQPAPNAS